MKSCFNAVTKTTQTEQRKCRKWDARGWWICKCDLKKATPFFAGGSASQTERNGPQARRWARRASAKRAAVCQRGLLAKRDFRRREPRLRGDTALLCWANRAFLSSICGHLRRLCTGVFILLLNIKTIVLMRPWIIAISGWYVSWAHRIKSVLNNA